MAKPIFLLTVCGDQAVIAGNNFEGDAQLPQFGNGFDDPRFGRVEKDQKAHHKSFPLFCIIWKSGLPGCRPRPGDGNPLPLYSWLFFEPGPGLPTEGKRCRPQFQPVADGQDVGHGALGQDKTAVFLGHQDTEAFADKVIGDFIQFVIRRNVQIALSLKASSMGLAKPDSKTALR